MVVGMVIGVGATALGRPGAASPSGPRVGGNAVACRALAIVELLLLSGTVTRGPHGLLKGRRSTTNALGAVKATQQTGLVFDVNRAAKLPSPTSVTRWHLVRTIWSDGYGRRGIVCGSLMLTVAVRGRNFFHGNQKIVLNKKIISSWYPSSHSFSDMYTVFFWCFPTGIFRWKKAVGFGALSALACSGPGQPPCTPRWISISRIKRPPERIFAVLSLSMLCLGKQSLEKDARINRWKYCLWTEREAMEKFS